MKDIKQSLPELPKDKRKRMMREYGLTDKEARVLTEEKLVGDFYEAAVKLSGKPKETANWMMTEVLRVLKAESVIPITSKQLAELIIEVEKGTINRTVAKEVFEEMINTDRSVFQIIETRGLQQISAQNILEEVVDKVLTENSKAVADYQVGKTQSFGFLMGQCMKATKGQGNPNKVRIILENKLTQ